MNKQKKLLQMVIGGIGFIGLSVFLYFTLNIPLYFSIIFGASIILIYILGRFKNFYSTVLTFIIIGFNLISLVFALLPTYEKQVDLEDFYIQKNNVIKIAINDDYETIEKSKAKLILRRLDETTGKVDKKSTFDFSNINETFEHILNQNASYKINYLTRNKDLLSTINVHTWDGSIIRVLPQSSVRVEKIEKNYENLMNSETNISVESGSIWFKVIKTISKDDGFNVETRHGVITIRGTSGLITSDKKSSIVYANDHILEITNDEGSKLIEKGDITKFNNTKFADSSIDSLKQALFDNIETNIDQYFEQYKSLDIKDVQEYKNQLIEYIKQNFSWKFDDYDFINKIALQKAKLLTLFDEKYNDSIYNYEKYKLLVGLDSQIEKFEQKYKLQDTIITPLNERLGELKLDYLEQLSKEDLQALKSYILNKSNSLYDQGKNIDLSSVNTIYYELKGDKYIGSVKNVFNQFLNQY